MPYSRGPEKKAIMNNLNLYMTVESTLLILLLIDDLVSENGGVTCKVESRSIN